MFECKKKIKQIQEEEKKLIELKEELLKIKEIMEEESPKIDISNVFVFEVDGIYYFVKKEMTQILGDTIFNKNALGYLTILRNIFNDNDIIYKKSSLKTIERNEYLMNNIDFYFNDKYAKFYPIHELDSSLLAFVDKKVPFYVLQQLFCKVNNVDLNANILKKRK